MKKFKFNLESVLRYRTNTERNEKTVLANMNAQLMEYERQRAALQDEYSAKAKEFEEISSQGVTVYEIRSNHAFMKNIAYGIEIKTQEIEDQTALVEGQTDVVVRAMQDTKTLDRLKEKKYKTYAHGERKADEKFIEEFVNNSESRSAAT